MDNTTPQDQAAEACLNVPNEENAESQPAGDAFVDRSDINPRRRIVRARRPPPAASGSSANGGVNIAADGTSAAVAGGQGSLFNNEGGVVAGNRADRNSNAAGNPDLSGAIGFLQQLNREPGTTAGSGNGANDREATSHSAPVATSNRVTPERNMQAEENYDDDDEGEDSEDDDGSLGPPSRFFQGFLNHMSEMARRSERRHKEDLTANIRPDDDDEDSDEEHGDESLRCAACFRPDNQNHKWRRLVTLPCCGNNGRERNSSTRFCAACILKLAVTRASSSNTSEYRLYDDEPDEYPVRKFYQKSLQTESRRFCECPRCRDILLVKIKGIKHSSNKRGYNDDSSDECDCSDCEAERRERNEEREDAKTAKSISISLPTFKAKVWYIGRKRGIAKLLWKVSLLHHNFLSYEALGGDDEKAAILKLAGYGIIEKVPGKRNTSIYRIDKGNQTKLIKFFRLKDPGEKDQKSENILVSELEPFILHAAWIHLRQEWRIDRSLRLLNRFFFLVLHFFGYLPPLPLTWRQELVVTALIVFLLAMLAQFICVLAVYGFVFFGVGLSVCYVLKRSNNMKSCWWQAILVSYFVYKLNVFFYGSPYMSWGVLVSPRALTPLLKLVWG